MQRPNLGVFRNLVCLVLPLLAGCLPENIGASPHPGRTLVSESASAALYTEDGVDTSFWLEAERGDEPGRVGGYLSDPPAHGAGLVLLLCGASSFDPEGPLGVTRYSHHFFQDDFSARGLRIWTIQRRECGTPYGQDDLRDVLQAIDWLEREGGAWLGVERVYLYGFSTGGTVATLANRQRNVTAVVSIGGLTRPDQFWQQRGLYETLTDLFPQNTGICQLKSTLDQYGPVDSPGWQTLNTVDHLEELRNPSFFIQGGLDLVYSSENLLKLRARYEQLQAAGATLAPAEFLFLPTADHARPVNDPVVIGKTLDFLVRFEPSPDPPAP